ncbi:MAG: hypothetical protein KKF41_07070 [Actinobacteria bacterium]|nr:hypothetical protein [Actinomycetota bacterium]MBU1942949.1 hypothetical protein [Actinomycetota bacterium]MBU2687329.1 hypothetical protein [Actinomycetota bacterium]
MKQYTIRGVPLEIEKMVHEEARKTGLSVNKAFVSLLDRALSREAPAGGRKVHDDLDTLFGVWGEAEFQTFERELELQRKVDEELWQRER